MTAEVAPLEIDELLHEVADILSTHRDSNGRLAQIQIRAKRLLQVNGAPRLSALNVLMLTALGLGQTSNVEMWGGLLFNDQWTEAGMLQNASQAFLHIGSIQKANDVAAALVERYPDSKSALTASARTFQLTLRFSEALEQIRRYDLLAVNEKPEFGERERKMLTSSVDLLEGRVLTEEDLSLRLSEAVTAVRSAGSNVCRVGRLVLNDGSFVSHLFVDASAPRCAELNFVIIDALIDKFDDLGSDIFSIACRPFDDYWDTYSVHHS
jgi:hypothetical protein